MSETKTVKAWAVIYKKWKTDPEIDIYKNKQKAIADMKFWGGEKLARVTITYEVSR